MLLARTLACSVRPISGRLAPAAMALSIADRGYVLATGELVLADTAQNLLASEDLKRAYLGR